MKLTLYLIVSTALSHAKRNRTALFLNHREVLQVFICVKKEFASVELYQDACHRPDVTLFIPRDVFKYDFRCSVLPGVDDQSVTLVRISCPTEVNDLDLTRGRLAPLAANLLALTREVA